MKKVIFCIFIVTICIMGCKKDNNDTTNNSNSNNSIDPVGTWTFESQTSTQNGNTFTINSTTYPCTAKNLLLINSDGTANSSYSGNDTCYIVNTPTMVETFGQKGDSRNGTWTKSGNIFYLTLGNATKPVVGQLSIVNSKYQMTYKDTLPSINLFETTTYVK